MLLTIEVKQFKTFFLPLLVQSFIIGWLFNFSWDKQSVGQTVRGMNSPWYEQSVDELSGDEQFPNQILSSYNTFINNVQRVLSLKIKVRMSLTAADNAKKSQV